MDDGVPPLSMEGYLLKKKRKKIQGMARRYFRLSTSGALSYSFRPGSPIRDSVFVSLAYVTASRKQRTFHIDTGSLVWHCKALTADDFEKWTSALRECSATVVEQVAAPTRKGSMGGHHPALVAMEQERALALDLPTLFAAVTKMAHPIQELEAMVAELRSHEGSPMHHTPSPGQSHSVSPSPKFKFLKKQQGKDHRVDDYFDIKPTNDALTKQLIQIVSVLRAQHDILTNTLSSSPISSRNGPPSSLSKELSPLRTWTSMSSAGFPRSTASRASSVNSGETQDFFEDALPGEFILEEEVSEDESGSSDGEDEEESSFTSLEEDSELHHGHSIGQPEAETTRDPDTATLQGRDGGIHRREQLPAPISGDEFSMLGMLRKNVGKDLSTISFPVTMNEPLSALQRIAEELEYSDLLHRAAETQDSIERLTLVAAFAISGAAGNKFRTSRKPFNPLLGETYECIRPDKGFKFISEKVSHHPPVMAFHADGKGWKIDGHVAPSQKFWGRSMEVFVTGEFNITFTDTKEVFSVRKPSSFVRNLVAGSKYLEIVGDLVITNEESGEKATIAFKEGSAWGGSSSRNKIEGKVCDEHGRTKAELVGRWDDRVDKKEGKDSFQRLWQIAEFPPHAAQQYYGFSKFGVELNEVTELEDGFLAPSDSRLRPDQLALEHGDVEHAEELKKKVEEKQRAKRKTGGPHVPEFFVPNGDGWKYDGHYFEKRERKAFKDPDIF